MLRFPTELILDTVTFCPTRVSAVYVPWIFSESA
jgi:hypothetical protein